MASGENILWYVEYQNKRGALKCFLFRTWRAAAKWRKKNVDRYGWIGITHRATWGPNE